MVEIIIGIEGMKCGMCETHVNDVIRRILNVKKVTSSHKKNRSIVIAEDDVNQEEIISAIKTQGYNVLNVETKPYIKHSIFSRK